MFSKRQHFSIHQPVSQERRLRGLESLESRLCLSGSSLVVNNDFDWGDLQVSEITSSGTVLTAPPTAVADKIDGLLWAALQDELTGSAEVAALTSVNPGLDVNPLSNGRAKVGANGEVEVVVEVAAWSPDTIDLLGDLGLEVDLFNAELRKAQGWASPEDIEDILADASVSTVSLPYYGVANAGVVDTGGDAIHRADDVREIFAGQGIDGSGIRVGVISDGVANRATIAAGGDLPSNISVNPALAGAGDEGTAMLEIAHDLAPGAELFFSSGISGTLGMINSINWMVAQGVDIIVDDLSFFDQPYFADGAIANAVRGAVDSGVSYFSAAGNQAEDHYQTSYTASGYALTDPADGEIQHIHEMRPGDLTLAVAIEANGGSLDATLQWSDPFGASTNDYNLFLLDVNGQVVPGLVRVDQNGTQDPFESISVTNTGSGNFIGSLLITRDVGAADRELELFVRNDLQQEFFNPSDGIVGHQAVTEINTIGAIDQGDPGNDDIEVFSSRGTSTIYTNFATQASTARSSLDGAAIDNVATRTGQLGFTAANGSSLYPFRGTSAAAPHAAAIAALLLDANPALSPAQVSTILADTAIDILNAGYDLVSGAGRFDALTAVTSVLPPTITDVRLDGTGWTGLDPISFADRVSIGQQLRPVATEGVNTIEIQFSEAVTVVKDNFEVVQTVRQANGTAVTSSISALDYVFNYDPVNFVGKLTFNNALPDGKFAIHLSDDVEDLAGNKLDGEWSDSPGYDSQGRTTYDNYADDPPRTFSVGNGVEGSPDGEFRFHFALLAGDYNGDGIVEAGEPVTLDGDGDGTIGDADDIAIRNAQAAAGAKLPLRDAGGDFNDDEIVDYMDLVLLQNGYGTEYDGVGFLAWQRSFNNRSAWYQEPIGPAAATVGLPPQVLNVTISGSSSLHDPFSFDTVDGDGGQLATVPVGGADTISITFSEAVNVAADNLFVVGLTTANLPTLGDFSYDAGTNTATWRYEGWALGDNYLLSLSDAVTDVEGNLLDGEWFNPATIASTDASISTFPSGDGSAGGRFNFAMTLLPGDANLDGVVDGDDFSLLSNNYGNLIDQEFTDGDFDGDGDVDINDFNLLANHFGTNLQSLSTLADFDGDHNVDGDDLAVISGNFGMTGATWADGDLDGDGEVGIGDLDLAFAQYGLQFAAA